MVHKHLASLDAIRLFAALIVTAYHFFFTFWAAPDGLTLTLVNKRPSMTDLAPYSWFGWVGVQIFFVLSGVVISYSAAGSSALKFVRNRFLRLAPAAWISAMLGLAVLYVLSAAPAAASERGDLLQSFFNQISFFPLWPYIDPPFWTIGVEITFYAMVFFLLAAGWFRHLPLVAALLGMISAFYVSAVAASCGLDWGGAMCGALTSFPRLTQILLLEHGCFFAIGVLIWKRFLLNRAGAIDWLFLPSLFGCFAEIYFANLQDVNAYREVGFLSAKKWAVPALVWAASIAAIAWATRFDHLSPDRWSGLLRAGGLATYPLYLIHTNLGCAIIVWLYALGASPGISGLAALLVCTSLSFVIALLVEPRIKAGLRHVLDRIAASLPRLKT